MDYFKRAASAVLSSAAGPFPGYTLGERDAWLANRTLWTQHAGVRRDDGLRVSILCFDAAASPQRRNLLPLAKNALRKLRTLRHPSVLRLLDSHETQTAVWIAVERVRPLGQALEEMRRDAPGRDEWIAWGLRSIAVSRVRSSVVGVCCEERGPRRARSGAAGMPPARAQHRLCCPSPLRQQGAA
jgi:SCY1-like protein 1